MDPTKTTNWTLEIINNFNWFQFRLFTKKKKKTEIKICRFLVAFKEFFFFFFVCAQTLLFIITIIIIIISIVVHSRAHTNNTLVQLVAWALMSYNTISWMMRARVREKDWTLWRSDLGGQSINHLNREILCDSFSMVGSRFFFFFLLRTLFCYGIS